MLTLRTRIFILITFVVLFILGISLLLVVKIKDKPAANAPSGNLPEASQQNNLPTPGTTATVIPQNVTVAPLDASDVTENTIRQLARIFVERFNTYSSDNMYQNIRDVETLVAADYWKKISAPLSRPSAPPAQFVSLTTKVLAISSSNVQTTMATVVLKAQKSSVSGATSAVGYADYAVSLVKVGSDWLVLNEVENK
ncbi:MAG: hypothetical protein AAB467_01665 [Patescibacteria group bacterium]